MHISGTQNVGDGIPKGAGVGATPVKPPFRLCVAATFTAEPIEPSLGFWCRRLGWPERSVRFAPYGQFFQQLLDPGSELAAPGPGVNLLMIRLADFCRSAVPAEGARVLRESVDELVALTTGFVRRSPRPVLAYLGQTAPMSGEDTALARLADTLTGEVESQLRTVPNLMVLTEREVRGRYPVAAVADEDSDRQWHIPYTPDYWTALGTALARRARAATQAPCKVIVVDADNTLWDGVVAEVGPLGIGIGTSRRGIQERLLELRRSGVLLALASKNHEVDVDAAFANPAMVLSRSDFVGWKVNWNPKSENLLELGRELGLGTDTFVFLDDNPVECAEVAGRCPEVTTICLSADAEAAFGQLGHIWALDVHSVTAADRERTELYQREAARRELRAKAGSMKEFIEGLGLRVEWLEPGGANLERAAQLTQRTNQFNADPVRRNAAELAAWLGTAGQGGFLVRVSDRFGAHGDVGLVAWEERADSLCAAHFLLSCRVLGKGVEHQMMAELGRRALALGKPALKIRFRKTERNEPAARFLASAGGSFGADDTWEIPATAAAAIRFDPDAAHPANDGKNESGESGTRGANGGQPSGGGRIDFADISASLADVASIARAIRREFVRPRPAALAPAVPVATEVESAVAAMWEETLGVAPVGLEDGFLELGGQSIQAAQLLARVRSEFGVRIPLAEFMGGQRLGEMCARLEAAGPGQRTPWTRRLPKVSEPVLSAAQERMWFLDQFIPRRAAYNIVGAWRIRGEIRRDAWKTALEVVVARHEPLRTVVVRSATGRRVTLLDGPGVEVRFSECSGEEEALRRLAEDAAQPFDLSKGPLIRCTVVSSDARTHWCSFNVHHMAADGWSMGILYREWSEAYAAANDGLPPSVQRLAATYSDHAAWMAERSAGEGFRAELEHWTARLANAPSLLELPTDLPRPAVMAYEGAVVTGRLSHALGGKVRALATAVGATPFMVYLAAFQALLHRYSGQTDILVGTPVSGRNHPAVEGLIGCFVNTVVIRNRVESATRFRDQVGAVRGSVWEALAHDELPFERLVDAMKLERDLSRSPLFQAMLVLQNAPPGVPRAEGWDVEPVVVHNTGAKFDLVLELTPDGDGDGCRLVFEYNSRLYLPDTIQRMLGHFVRLLESACDAPETEIARLPMMSEAELSAIRTDFSEVQAAYPVVDCLHVTFEKQVERTPEARALTCEGRHLTYAELNRRANRLAHRLVGLGVRPDDLVGIYLDRTDELVVAILGVLKAGGAYLPIDPSYPADRLGFMIEDAKAPVLVTQRSLADALPSSPAVRVLAEEVLGDGGAGMPETNPGVAVAPDHLAYVIYTSGSTGRPKGCMVSHRNVARLMLATEPWFGFNGEDVWTLFHSCAFDFSVWEIWGALLYGGRLVVVPYMVSRSPAAFYNLLADEQVTVLNQTPSAFRQLIVAEENVGQRPLALRYVVFGGEALEMASLKPWFDRHGDARPRLVNMYGITETTVHVTYRPLTRDDVVKASVIGVPIPDLELHILDEHRHPVPVGVPGEIYVGGGGVARGYLRREELTASRFVPHPYRPGTGDRLYRTGDLARFLPGRDVEYLGRIDMQVKIRGFRIELGEIETVLCQHAGVREAVVIAREDTPGDKRLVGYVATEAGEAIVPELRELLRKKVPEYMVPSAFVVLAKLPLTNNGKIDRRALPKPSVQRAAGALQGGAAQNDLERSIAKLCQAVLRLENIGMEDNFFDLGAHSILLVGLHQRLQTELGLGLQLVDLFHHPTIRGLARHAGGKSGGADGVEAAADVSDRARKQREAMRRLQSRRSG